MQSHGNFFSYEFNDACFLDSDEALSFEKLLLLDALLFLSFLLLSEDEPFIFEDFIPFRFPPFPSVEVELCEDMKEELSSCECSVGEEEMEQSCALVKASANALSAE